MALYRLNQDDGVTKTDTNQNIPNAVENADWRDYQDWLNEGNTPDPFVPVPAKTIDQEFDELSDWLKEVIGTNAAAIKAKVIARRATQILSGGQNGGS